MSRRTVALGGLAAVALFVIAATAGGAVASAAFLLALFVSVATLGLAVAPLLESIGNRGKHGLLAAQASAGGADQCTICGATLDPQPAVRFCTWCDQAPPT